MVRIGLAVWPITWAAACLVYLGSPAVMAEAPDLTLALPRMEPCQRDNHPLLPARWRGVFLMTPFTPSQLVISEIVYDEAVPAMAVKLFGVRSGAANLLVLKDRLFSLSAEGPRARCEELERREWVPLPRDLLAPSAQCAGVSPILETPVEWWKSPSEPAPLADWMWFKPSDRSPFRLLFQRPSDHLSVLSAFAVSHQVHFEPLKETDLAARAATCAEGGRSRRQLHEVLDALKDAPSRADAELQRLFPELQMQCSSTRPHWPDALGMTMFLTPLDFSTNPVPAEVLYNWKLRSQRTRMFWGAEQPTTEEDALMLAEHGYSVSRQRSGDVQCIPALPGTPRPNWLQEAPCICEGMIEGGSTLAPYGPVEILRCPATPPRLFWTWHTRAGRPMMFMVTPSSGDEPTALITLADYYAWVPGYPSSASLFARPAQCPDLSAGRGRKLPRSAGRAPEPCGGCHLTFDQPR